MRRQAAGQFGMGFARRGQGRQLILRSIQDRFDDAVHQQVGITANRAGEVGIGGVSQTEVTAVDRCVNRLLHRAQQHGVDLL